MSTIIGIALLLVVFKLARANHNNHFRGPNNYDPRSQEYYHSNQNYYRNDSYHDQRYTQGYESHYPTDSRRYKQQDYSRYNTGNCRNSRGYSMDEVYGYNDVDNLYQSGEQFGTQPQQMYRTMNQQPKQTASHPHQGNVRGF